jgi:hypothetical protein
MCLTTRVINNENHSHCQQLFNFPQSLTIKIRPRPFWLESLKHEVFRSSAQSTSGSRGQYRSAQGLVRGSAWKKTKKSTVFAGLTQRKRCKRNNWIKSKEWGSLHSKGPYSSYRLVLLKCGSSRRNNICWRHN